MIFWISFVSYPQRDKEEKWSAYLYVKHSLSIKAFETYDFVFRNSIYEQQRVVYKKHLSYLILLVDSSVNIDQTPPPRG